MSLPFALFATGNLLNTLGKFEADQGEAAAERQNASFYREQEKNTLDQMFMDLSVFDRKATATKGEQLQFVGSQGIAITSNVLDKLGDESALMERERNMIQRNGEFKARLANLKAQQSDQNAAQLGSFERQFMNFSGLLTGAAYLK